jgi:hypothetical protein
MAGIEAGDVSIAGAPFKGQEGKLGGLVSWVAGTLPVVVSTVARCRLWRLLAFQTVVTVARAGLAVPAAAHSRAACVPQAAIATAVPARIPVTRALYLTVAMSVFLSERPGSEELGYLQEHRRLGTFQEPFTRISPGAQTPG